MNNTVIVPMGQRSDSNSEVTVCYRADHNHMLVRKPNSCRETISCLLWPVSFGSDYRSTQQTYLYLQVYHSFQAAPLAKHIDRMQVAIGDRATTRYLYICFSFTFSKIEEFVKVCIDE